jgi:hypothetical protein
MVEKKYGKGHKGYPGFQGPGMVFLQSCKTSDQTEEICVGKVVG